MHQHYSSITIHTMWLQMIALNEEGYALVKPLVEKMEASEDTKDREWHGEIQVDDPMELIRTARESREKVLEVALSLAVKTEELQENDQEVTAHCDITETIGRIKPETEPFLTELDSYLFSPDKLKELYAQFTKLLSSLNIEEVIKSHGYFNDEVPMEVYKRALMKNNQMMEYCIENNLALLCMIVGDP